MMKAEPVTTTDHYPIKSFLSSQLLVVESTEQRP